MLPNTYTKPGHPGSRTTFAALAFLVLSAGCGGDAQFNARFAPGALPPRPTVSVFGVYTDGRMSAGAWEKVAPALTPALGGQPCEVLFSDRLATTEPKASAEIDRQTREEGVTPEILQQIAPRATGNFILLVDMYGKLPVRGSEPPGVRGGMGGPTGMPGGGMQGGGMRGGGMRGGGMRGASHDAQGPSRKDDNALELSATLFAAETQEPVGRVSMRYTGASVDDALAKFAARLRAELPGATCVGWKWKDAAPARSVDAP
jgi:hypothetical protein